MIYVLCTDSTSSANFCIHVFIQWAKKFELLEEGSIITHSFENILERISDNIFVVRYLQSRDHQHQSNSVCENLTLYFNVRYLHL